MEIDVYLLFFYCIGSKIMIVSILGRRFGYICIFIIIVRFVYVVFVIIILINDKSDNFVLVSLFFGLCLDIFIEKDEVI